MFSNYFLKLSAVITGVLLLTSSWLTSARSPDHSPRLKTCSEKDAYVVRKLDSDEQVEFRENHGIKVALMFDTVSRCGYTHQYEDLEKLYPEYRDGAFVVVGFPSNDFGNQEPGKEKQMKTFCRLTYGVQFPMHAKTRAKGGDADPLYRSLAKAAGQGPRWNFHVYLIDREGKLAGSYGSAVEPRSDALVGAIERLL